jgi:pimeloyl-ACP methyl ester carboxylesterase
MRQQIAVDGFRLAYDRVGQGSRNPAVLLLHGWPGDRTDYRDVTPLLATAASRPRPSPRP